MEHRNPVQKFWYFYYRLRSFMARADGFAKECGYSLGALHVPEQDMESFITMFWEDEAKKRELIG